MIFGETNRILKTIHCTLIASIFFFLLSCKNEETTQIISSDIDNFWVAYDKIKSTDDTLLKQKYLQENFIDKASLGQEKMFEVRNYTVEEYLDAIKKYPKFWTSLRKNTLDFTHHNAEILKGIAKLRAVYPEMKNSPVYYTMGAFRSPGTGVDRILILGTEFALGDLNIDTSEFKGDKEHIITYHNIDPLQYLQSLSIHEYIHTQQNYPVYNILSWTLYEGIAEFIGTHLTAQKSPWSAFRYGPQNEEFVKNTFEHQLFDSGNMDNWLWSNNNQFGHRDLGYFIGYSIAKIYYEKADDKNLAIKQLIELDYENETEVERLVNGTNYFSGTLEELYNRYESNRPKVLGIKQFKNGSLDVDASITLVTIQFSEPMNPNHRGFDFGPLGKENAMIMTKYIGFSKDSTEVSFEVNLESNKKYQLQLPSKFMDLSGHFIKPYLIEFKTH